MADQQRIPSGMYDAEYFLSEACPGAHAFRTGRLPHTEMQDAILQLAAIQANEVALDFGTGRGEVTLQAAQRARLAIGVDYSAAALSHTRRTKALVDSSVAARARFIRAGAGALPLQSSSVDVVLMLDVIEHLDPEEVAATLAEFHRILRPGGRVLIHTPNRLEYDVAWPYWGYFVSAGVRLLTGRRPAISRNKRTEPERRFHINEHSGRQLREVLKAVGFQQVSVTPCTFFGWPLWSVSGLYVRVGQYLRPLSLLPPLSEIFNHSLVGTARKAEVASVKIRLD